MANLSVKSSIEQHFITNWTQTPIQFDGEKFDFSGKTSWISLVYAPAVNSQYAFDGSPTGRILSEGSLKVFCYAKSLPLAMGLADNVESFLNGENLSGVEMGIGSTSQGSNLENGYFEVPTTFNVRLWS